ncbi:MAG: hypothetical protein RL381_971 [Actinomycetota bacterium]|jgi:L-lysine exporter family protein LysE/ArgO
MLSMIPGFLTGLSLIVAIGAQNAFVIKQGLLRSNVFTVVLLCSISDALLIVLGTGGLGTLIQSQPELLTFIRWFGVAYLSWFGIKSLKSAFKSNVLVASEIDESTKLKVVFTALALTYLNPHVYLDTVIFVGGLANQFDSDKWFFALGASAASFIWFFSIGYGAKAASRVMSKPIFWRILDITISVIMFAIAITLALFKF